jgi:hypothetical protein
MSISENYEGEITPIRSNISRFSRGTVDERICQVRILEVAAREAAVGKVSAEEDDVLEIRPVEPLAAEGSAGEIFSTQTRGIPQISHRNFEERFAKNILDHGLGLWSRRTKEIA